MNGDEEARFAWMLRFRSILYRVSLVSLGAAFAHATHGHYWAATAAGAVSMALVLADLALGRRYGYPPH